MRTDICMQYVRIENNYSFENPWISCRKVVVFYEIFEMGKYVWTTYLIRTPGIHFKFTKREIMVGKHMLSELISGFLSQQSVWGGLFAIILTDRLNHLKNAKLCNNISFQTGTQHFFFLILLLPSRVHRNAQCCQAKESFQVQEEGLDMIDYNSKNFNNFENIFRFEKYGLCFPGKFQT